MNRLPVMIVTNDDVDLLAVTLSSLLSSVTEIPLDIRVTYHGCLTPDTSRAMESLRALFALSNHQFAEFEEHELTYQQTRAREVRHAHANGAEWMFISDGDLWFHPFALGSLIKVADPTKFSAIAIGKIDTTNERGYEDWSLTPYADLETYVAKWGTKKGYTGCLFEKSYTAEYCEGNSLWHVPSLVASGALEMWDEYPIRQRGYDLKAGLQMVEHSGRPAMHLQNPTVLGTPLTIWHLNTGPDGNHFDQTDDDTLDLFEGQGAAA